MSKGIIDLTTQELDSRIIEKVGTERFYKYIKDQKGNILDEDEYLIQEAEVEVELLSANPDVNFPNDRDVNLKVVSDRDVNKTRCKLNRDVNKEKGNSLSDRDVNPGSSMNADRVGEHNPNSKAVIHLESGKVFSTINDASDFFGISRQTISKHCNGKVQKQKIRFV